MRNKFVGTLSDAMRVYVDKHASNATVLPYKSKSGMDAGAFYCPQIPLYTSGAVIYPPIEEVEGVWKFLLRRNSESDLPRHFANQIAVDAFEWIEKNVAHSAYQITYVQSDDFGTPNYKTRYGYVDPSAAPPHHHMIVEFFEQKDAALFKLMHL